MFEASLRSDIADAEMSAGGRGSLARLPDRAQGSCAAFDPIDHVTRDPIVGAASFANSISALASAAMKPRAPLQQLHQLANSGTLRHAPLSSAFEPRGPE